MSKSSIEWTTETWNPIVGCSIVSPGCTNCYAMKEAYRFGFNPSLERYHGLTKLVNDKPVWTGNLNQAPDSTLLAPLKRKKPTTYFVNLMSDLFHEDCPDEWIDRVFAVMALSPQHTFQILTKRAKRMRDYCIDARVRAPGFVERACGIAQQIPGMDASSMRYLNIVAKVGAVYPLPNVWLGVSTERQQEADERIPLLLQTPAVIRFISAEPLLGPIDLTVPNIDIGIGRYKSHPDLDWVIVGGESGPDARPMHPDWARSLRDQCRATNVAYFFKQWGSHAPSFMAKPESGIFFDSGKMVACNKRAAGRLLDGIEHNEMPEAR